MIRVNEKYGIIVSNTDYCVVALKNNQKTGEEYNVPQSYHADIESALKKIAKYTIRDAVSGGDMTIDEACAAIRDAMDKLAEDIEKAVPKAKVKTSE